MNIEIKGGGHLSDVSTWSGIRNKLENDYLCPALRGHIQYFTTSYSKSHDHEGRAAIRLDGVVVLRSNYYAYYQNYWNRYQEIRAGISAKENPKIPSRLAYEGALNDGRFDNWFFYVKILIIFICSYFFIYCIRI